MSIIAPRPIHHAVIFEGQEAKGAIPFGAPGPAISLAKRATFGEPSRPARAVEVYEHDGKHYDVNGTEVKMREARP